MPHISFKEVDYKTLNGRQQEIYNFQTVAGRLAKYGFNCIKLSDDWQGADFLAYHFDRKTTLKVQLKPRLAIYRKYEGEDLHVAFPHKDDWYLVEHDVLVKELGRNTKCLQTPSWNKKNGFYHTAAPSRKVIEALKDFRL